MEQNSCGLLEGCRSQEVVYWGRRIWKRCGPEEREPDWESGDLLNTIFDSLRNVEQIIAPLCASLTPHIKW